MKNINKNLIVFLLFFFISGLVCSQNKYLIVLDIQEEFIKDKSYEDSAVQMIEKVNSLVSQFDHEKVVYIKSAGKVLNAGCTGFSVDTMPAFEFDKRLKVVNDNIFIKVSTGNAFESPELEKFLRDKKVSEIIIVGLLAEKCIYSTAMGGKECGYKVIVVKEAVTGKSEKSKAKAIEKMIKNGIGIMAIADIN